jgi:branched-chain amino acid transport system ATP-binding protein
MRSLVVPPRDDKRVLEVTNLHAGYGAVQVLHGISLEVRAGETVALIGANGAGKTTTLLTISGLIRPRVGSIRFDGHDIARRPPHLIARAGLVQVPEGRQLFAGMTVLENLTMGAVSLPRGAAALAPGPPRSGSSAEAKESPAASERRLSAPATGANGLAERLAMVFELFPILDERRRQVVGSLSGGQQQMVAIGRALMARPRLLMLDEPSLGLDPKTTASVFGVLRRIREMNVAVLIVEQDAVRTLQLADRAYVLESGEITLHGTGADLLVSPALRSAYLGL